MTTLPLHHTIELAWAYSSVEACAAGAEAIEPAHLLLALLKVLDEGFCESLDSDISAEVRAQIRMDADRARALLTLTASGLTKARRALRQYLRQGKQPTPSRQLHRSARTRALMNEAARRARVQRASNFTLAHLLRVLLENLPDEARPFLASQARKPEQGAEIRDGDTPAHFPAGAGPIELLGRDLTALARQGRLPQVVGRRAEMTMLARYLHRTSKRNAILVGDAGVGKTAVVEGLAQKIASGEVPELLRSLRIVQVNVGDLMSGTRYRGDLEERVQALLTHASSNPNLVLFLDEIHLVVNSGSGTSALDIANLLKPALSREDFRCIGATTTEGFERYIKPDAAFVRRFQVLRVPEPSREEALAVCRGWAQRIAQIQHVVFTDEAVQAAVDLSARLLRGCALPDKAIDLLENAAAFVRITSLSRGRDSRPAKETPTVGEADVAAVLEEQYGVSAFVSTSFEPAAISSALKARVVGQDAAIKAISDSCKAVASRPQTETRPLAVFVFAGPSGVGKTFTAESLATVLFPADPVSLGRFNMNELKERHEIARLIGAPPGFVGHDQQGALFKFASTHPRGLVLLDEMDKAHPEIQDYFLQIFDKAEASDARGTKADFRNYVFVMTCNAAQGGPDSRIGFVTTTEDAKPRNHGRLELETVFRKELLARVDLIIHFNPLDEVARREFLVRQTIALRVELQERVGIDLELTPSAEAWILAAAASERSARDLLRNFEKHVRTQVLSFSTSVQAGRRIRLDYDGKGLRCME